MVSLLYHSEPPGILVEKSFSYSSLTHGHIRSQLCCAYFSLVVKAVMKGECFESAIEYAANEIRPFCPDNEIEYFSRILDTSIAEIAADKIESSRYVIHTLETALHCTAKSSSFEEAVLCAVNLGEDTDAAAALTGALNGLIYGSDSIPCEWQQSLAKKEMIDNVTDKFTDEFFNID